jgi:hypothetical protein
VDQSSEAQPISENWPTSTDPKNLRSGKIREPLCVYLVGTVEVASLHRLRHQVEIRGWDGHLIVLDPTS